MSMDCIILSPSQSVISLTHYYCMLTGETANTNFIVFCSIRSWVESTICHTEDYHANNYTISPTTCMLYTIRNTKAFFIAVAPRLIQDLPLFYLFTDTVDSFVVVGIT